MNRKTYRNKSGDPVIFANRTQAENKARQLGEGWEVYQSPLSRRFYVEMRHPNPSLGEAAISSEHPIFSTPKEIEGQ